MKAADVKPLCILGFGGHARSVADVAVSAGFRDIVFVDENTRPGETFAGFPAFSLLDEPGRKPLLLFPAAGDNRRRECQVKKALHPFATLVAPSASVGLEAQVAVATFVAHHAHLGPLTRIGRGVIVNTGAIVDHESVVADFSHISVNSTIGGRSSIGQRVMLGAGAVVIDGISVCDDVVIGAGATVVDNITQSGLYVGTPARRIK